MKEQMIEILKSCQHCMDDYAQRSALGIADSFVRGGNVDLKDVRYAPEGHPISRDGLADALIAVIVEADSEIDENRKALRGTRAWVNEPFTNTPEMKAFRARQAAAGPLSDPKKGKAER